MVQPEWFDGVQNLLITAGASAPERLVTEIIEHLIADFDGELIDESPVNESGNLTRIEIVSNEKYDDNVELYSTADNIVENNSEVGNGKILDE